MELKQAYIPPLEVPLDLSKGFLKVLKTYDIGKDVPTRTKILDSASKRVDFQEPNWHIQLAKAFQYLAVEDAKSILCAFEIAYTQCPNEISKTFFNVNSLSNSRTPNEFVISLITALKTYDEDFYTRTMNKKIDSDLFFARVVFAHLFDMSFSTPRDAASNIFVLQGVVDGIRRKRKGGIKLLTKETLERNATEVPANAIGYCVILSSDIGKTAMYTTYPSLEETDSFTRVKETLQKRFHITEPEQLENSIVGTAIDAYLSNNKPVTHSLLTAFLAERDHKYIIVKASQSKEGVTTSIYDIPASSVDEARYVAREMPVVEAHDKMMEFKEILSDIKGPSKYNS